MKLTDTAKAEEAWEALREKFLEECTDKTEAFYIHNTQPVIRFKENFEDPADVFEWFKNNQAKEPSCVELEEIKKNLVVYFNGDMAAAEMAFSICFHKKYIPRSAEEANQLTKEDN